MPPLKLPGQPHHALLLVVLSSLLLLSTACAPAADTPVATATTPATTAAAPTITTAASRTAIAPGASAATPGRASVPGATPAATASAATATNANQCAPGIELLGYSDALDKQQFNKTNIGGLSGLAYDQSQDRYYSLVDNERDTPARFYTLRLPLTDGHPGTPEVLAVTTLLNPSGTPYTGRNFDGEALVLLANGDLLIASETEPSIRRFTSDGHEIASLPVPARFGVQPRGEATDNLTFEALALSADQRTLYAGMEGPLAPDGLTAQLQPRLRILQYTLQPTAQVVAQYYYLAEPAQGIADMLWLSPTELLILERGFISNLGNTIRLFRVDLRNAQDVTNRTTLADHDLTPLPKQLLVDLGQCPAGGAKHPGRQQNPLLDNIESVALGPVLADGRQTLLLQSDDNFGADQVTRFYFLAFQR